MPISQLVRQYVPNPNDASVVVIQQQPQPHHLSNIHVNPTNSSGNIQGHNTSASPQHIHRYNRNNQLNYNIPRHQNLHHTQVHI